MESNYENHYSDEGIFGDISYSPPSVSRGLVISMALMDGMFFGIKGKVKILVVGAGSGYEIVNYLKHGHIVKGIDLYAPKVKAVRDVTFLGSAERMPFKTNEFNLVHCTEMLEHVPPNRVDRILNECKRVAKSFIFTIATRHDRPYNTHINIRSGSWWHDKFESMGFNISSTIIKPKIQVPVGKYLLYIGWPDGVLIYGKC